IATPKDPADPEATTSRERPQWHPERSVSTRTDRAIGRTPQERLHMTRMGSEARTTGRGGRRARMRAAVLAGPGQVEIREVDRPDPGPRQVRSQVEGCGVCGSNLPSWQGRPWFRYPLAPGAP